MKGGGPKHCLTRSRSSGDLVDAGAGQLRVGPASHRFLLVGGLAASRQAAPLATTDLQLERLVRVVRGWPRKIEESTDISSWYGVDSSSPIMVRVGLRAAGRSDPPSRRRVRPVLVVEDRRRYRRLKTVLLWPLLARPIRQAGLTQVASKDDRANEHRGARIRRRIRDLAAPISRREAEVCLEPRARRNPTSPIRPASAAVVPSAGVGRRRRPTRRHYDRDREERGDQR